MINQSKVSRLASFSQLLQPKRVLLLSIASVLLIASPAMAHHAMDGKMPRNFFEGFLSGLAHPLIGVDHFAFVVAIALLAVAKRQGIMIPIAFILSAMLGAGLHLIGLSLPGVELLIAASILIVGILLTRKDDLNSTTVFGLSAIAGVCHGYAYGEAIFGAQMTPMLAYLLGFTCIQLGVVLVVFKLGKRLLEQSQVSASLRSTGFVICGIGITFLFSQIIDVLVPLPKG
ncbi:MULTISPECIES: HupE/UreJ family protein [Leptolyngbya]|uniref:HupE/UreJ family protein n=1 Tax=Leptolyngbya TaxID=47251 RepID=UPI0016887A24|nr:MULTISPECIES: HupE/UreJ family protein [unclassified Leptolyngbya]MBD1857550.1 HupE/UreJ family protein [Leptolyngbya sp. FACHB-1624]MBN8560556.1 HupE/UreJ family protein [Leptolyngbya sp. UWPOB_LEPTO1]MCY6489599.1 HupE/UreJ family protein [Leptolyngbya sp. GGD]